MDKRAANMVLSDYGKPKKGEIRQTVSDIEQLEKETTEKLIEEWKRLLEKYILKTATKSEYQRLDLIELEFKERKIDEDLHDWYRKRKSQLKQ